MLRVCARTSIVRRPIDSRAITYWLRRPTSCPPQFRHEEKCSEVHAQTSLSGYDVTRNDGLGKPGENAARTWHLRIYAAVDLCAPDRHDLLFLHFFSASSITLLSFYRCTLFSFVRVTFCILRVDLFDWRASFLHISYVVVIPVERFNFAQTHTQRIHAQLNTNRSRSNEEADTRFLTVGITIWTHRRMHPPK